MSNEDMEKAFRNKLVCLTLKDCNIIKRIITGFELFANELHAITGKVHDISINRILSIELL